MKTITEYQPLIFTALLRRSDLRRAAKAPGPSWQVRRAAALTLGLGYVVLGLKITIDTGLAPWNWQFWLIFAPLFFLGEQLLILLGRRRRS